MMLSLKSLSTYRAQLMGIATILILVCHANPMVNSQPNILHKILNYGNFGVDIFLFLSGLGCYYSLTNRPSTKAFWHRRFVRMIIPYLIITLPFALFYLIIGRYTTSDFIYSLSTLDYWLYHRGAWFVALMIPLYLLTPVLFRLVRNGGGIEYFCLIICIIPLTVWFFISSDNVSNKDIIANIIGAFSRAPSFLLGMAVAPYIKDGSKKVVYIMLALAIPYLILRLFHISVPWLITPLVTLLLAKFCEMIPGAGVIYNTLTVFGGISLESYLYNIDLNDLFRYLITDYESSTMIVKLVTYTAVIVLGITLAYYSRKIINNKITSKIS